PIGAAAEARREIRDCPRHRTPYAPLFLRSPFPQQPGECLRERMHREYGDDFESGIASELRESISRVAAEISGTRVIRLQKRHGDDDVSADPDHARQLANGALRILHVLEHRVAERGIDAA